jgi:hypothetical protein
MGGGGGCAKRLIIEMKTELVADQQKGAEPVCGRVHGVGSLLRASETDLMQRRGDLSADFAGGVLLGVDVHVGLATQDQPLLLRAQDDLTRDGPLGAEPVAIKFSQVDQDARRLSCWRGTMNMSRRGRSGQALVADVECENVSIQPHQP